MPFDIASVRGLFPVLGDGWIYFDPQAGMQIPDSVASAVSRGFRAFPVVAGTHSPQARAAAATVDDARSAVADLLGADPAGVVLGSSRAALMAGLIDALPVNAWLNRNVVLSRSDDEAVLLPAVAGAARHGTQVRWAEIDVEDGSLPAWQFAEVVDDRTSLLAVTLASSVTGAITDIGPIAGHARAAGAHLLVDATTAAPYVPLSMAELGADVVLVSAERWGGPRVAAMVFADPALLSTLTRVSMNPAATGPARLEREPMPSAMLSGLIASIEYLSRLDSSATGSRRERVVASMDATYEYVHRLLFYLVNALTHLSTVRVVGPDVHRVPVVSFVVRGVAAVDVCTRLSDNGIAALSGIPSRALEAIGVDEIGGAVTVGLSSYSTPYEVDQLVRVLGSFG
ncbi:aminotransferase class V-fold PLP-dependent enzyme [Gordonia hydrophobica]|uniref:Aminotransferase class V-fold PLP-dependent enzyme n=1 Tax=Gordonia hydrophobica TaxID=40516 RepID=A0ABZ2U4N8_9ACTN|nr:aminotransferase class V-fold PLP-dependent enzyme [Gordonia hydrophobica]MBM7368238.1 cysteine desulfurase family protein (TIGR01976 family) [Gordonia hydrophobica]